MIASVPIVCTPCLPYMEAEEWRKTCSWIMSGRCEVDMGGEPVVCSGGPSSLRLD